MKEITITISFDVYERFLEQRREEIEEQFGWSIPEIVWDVAMEQLKDCGVSPGEPAVLVDNIAINGDYGDFDDYKEEGETDEEFIERAEDSALRVFPDERYVIWSLRI